MNSKHKQIASTFLLMALMLAGTLIASMMSRQEKRQFHQSYTHADVQNAIDNYQLTEETEELIALLHVLAYWGDTGDEAERQDNLRLYGQELLRRARDEEVDLEALDREHDMGSLLAAIREAGAR